MKKAFVIYVGFLFSLKAIAQLQVCPNNINFEDGSLTNWNAYIGKYNNGRTNPPPTVTNYPAASNSGVSSINEFYGQNGSGTPVPGITIITTTSTDYFGGFTTIPNINGYQYDKSILLGSTTIWGGSTGNYHGLFRGVSYIINVPAGSSTDAYTMTYAYAMVLEDGSHVNDQQPLAKATLTKPDGTIINCASPSYFLPTYGSNNILDTAAALQHGFTKSARPSPNANVSGDAYRVWYKPWAEVTFNLSAYRGQQVTLTFEADNCVPGGHFAYAYFALRKECNGLQISGPLAACSNTPATYTVPSLPGATNYIWTYPPGWKAKDSANFLYVTPTNVSGDVKVVQSNSCDTLTSTLNINVTAPTVAGNITGNSDVCTGINSTILSLTGNTGGVLNWLSSTDGTNWSIINDTLTTDTIKNIIQTTQYKAMVQNGSSCAIDTSSVATINVNQLSVGGNITPNPMNLCSSQNQDNIFKVNNNTGNILNWQYSYDSANWINFSPVNSTSSQTAITFSVPTQYRAIVKNGVCPADTSGFAGTTIYNDLYPNASISPNDTTLCYGDSAMLNIDITTATSYSWVNGANLTDPNSGNIPPYNFNAVVKPLQTYNYVIGFKNLGCPNVLLDTAIVNVYPRLVVNAGNDTSVVLNEPLQLNATVNVTGPVDYLWAPSNYLSNPLISNPIATFTSNQIDTFIYVVKAGNPVGCYATDSIKIAVFKTLPDIFIPTAFTPNGDRKNDLLKAIPVGIKTFEYFNVYNRYGQLLFTTPDPEKGWDGNLKGDKQPSGTYIYMVRGISYQNKVVFKKGTVVLIR